MLMLSWKLVSWTRKNEERELNEVVSRLQFPHNGRSSYDLTRQADDTELLKVTIKSNTHTQSHDKRNHITTKE